jgi:hypothetical protein
MIKYSSKGPVVFRSNLNPQIKTVETLEVHGCLDIKISELFYLPVFLHFCKSEGALKFYFARLSPSFFLFCWKQVEIEAQVENPNYSYSYSYSYYHLGSVYQC